MLIVGEIALALMLLVAAGTVVRGFLALRSASLGFEPDGVLTMKVDPPWSRFKRVEDTAPFYRRIIEEVERIPGVVGAATNDAPAAPPMMASIDNR
jgi:hypothetical protein